MTADAQTPTPEAASTQSFEADVSRLLHLMVHSVYSDRDIFVRELVSNAADACEKLRYEAIAKPELIDDGAPFAIDDRDRPGRQDPDLLRQRRRHDPRRPDQRASARSPAPAPGPSSTSSRPRTRARKPPPLIGQFGIGFYSAFMVADEVVVETRRAGADEAWRWSSDGKGAFTIAPLALESAPTRGTRVTLHLNDASQEFCAAADGSSASCATIPARSPCRSNSSRSPAPSKRRIADGAAIWAKPKSDVTPEEYAEFYRGLSGQFDEPALTLHWRAEGRHEYTVLAFIPGSRPFDLFDPARKGRNKLYVRRVLITEDADILPGWLRFVRLVVDSADLPLNVSREMIQKSDVFAAIRKGVTNRMVQELGKLAEAEPEKFAKVWEHFGAVIKEGLYEDPERRDGLFKIARFVTTAQPGRRPHARALCRQLAREPDGDLLSDRRRRRSASRRARSSKGFARAASKCCCSADPVDAFWVSTAAGFDGKPFKSVSQGAADIKSIALVEGAKAPAEATGEVATLFAFFKQTLGDEVADVRASDRLTDSVACLIAPEFGPDRQLEKMLAAHGRLASAPSRSSRSTRPIR